MSTALLTIGTYALILVVFIMSIVSYVRINKSDYHYIQELGENWNNGPIIDIHPSSSPNCKMGETVLIDDAWPGTVRGCSCPLYLSRDACNDDSFLCHDVFPVEPIQYRYWNNKVLCGKRIPASYLDLSIARSPDQCPNGQRSCGIVDSLSNVLCIPEETPCPINKLITLDEDEIAPNDFNYTEVSFFDGQKRFAYTNENTQGNILSELLVSEGKPCANPGYIDYVTEPYKLDVFYYRDKCKKMDTGDIYDPRAELIDTYTRKDLFIENGIFTIVSSLLPSYPVNMNPVVGLYARDYYGLSSQCKLRISQKLGAQGFLSSMVVFQESVEGALNFSFYTMIAGIVLFVFATVLLIVGIITSDGKTSPISSMFALANGIVSLVFLILVSIAAAKCNGLPEHYQMIAEPGCLDAITYEAISSFYSDFGSATAMNIANAVLSGLIFGLSIGTCVVSAISD